MSKKQLKSLSAVATVVIAVVIIFGGSIFDKGDASKTSVTESNPQPQAKVENASIPENSISNSSATTAKAIDPNVMKIQPQLSPEMEERLREQMNAQLEAGPPPLPEDLKSQLASNPPQLPADLQAQVDDQTVEIPEDIQRAIATPPREVSIEEVNNPNFSGN